MELLHDSLPPTLSDLNSAGKSSGRAWRSSSGMEGGLSSLDARGRRVPTSGRRHGAREVPCAASPCLLAWQRHSAWARAYAPPGRQPMVRRDSSSLNSGVGQEPHLNHAQPSHLVGSRFAGIPLMPLATTTMVTYCSCTSANMSFVYGPSSNVLADMNRTGFRGGQLA